MISKAFWFISRFESREEKFETEWQKFLTTERPNIDSIEKIHILKEIFEIYLSDSHFREIINNQKFADLASYPCINMSDLKIVWLENIYSMRNYTNKDLENTMKEFSLIK
jgi:hypothetical protein